MSGYTDDAVVRGGGLDAGTGFIQKPFSGEELGRRVRELLEGEVAA
jgi:DNA-binding response OmpR family regulator